MLLDSNIIIYATLPDGADLRRRLVTSTSSISAISRVEVLGYHSLQQQKREMLEAIFAQAEILPITDEIIERAIILRQQRRIKLGDSLIAATALVHDLTLVTRNTRDFTNVEGLQLHNPFDD